MKTVDDFIAEKRASCSPSLRMIGADKQIETYTRRKKKNESFTLENWLEAHRRRGEGKKLR